MRCEDEPVDEEKCEGDNEMRLFENAVEERTEDAPLEPACAPSLVTSEDEATEIEGFGAELLFEMSVCGTLTALKPAALVLASKSASS